jgi:lysophospholipid acyltransferase (LPLAT)-like uncharacterized protein
LQDTALTRFFLFPIGLALIRLLAFSYRFRHQPTRPAANQGSSYILAIWHQNLFAGILAQCGHPHVVMISRSRDGAPVSHLCEHLGHTVVRGSSKRQQVDKGGREAKTQMIERLRGGLPGAVTVDGPRGPAHEVKPGIIEMARLSGAPIVPYLAMPRRYWRFRSWDAFRLPKPFTRIDLWYGEPIHVAPDASFESFAACQQHIAEALHQLEQAARSAPPLGVIQPSGK